MRQEHSVSQDHPTKPNPRVLTIVGIVVGLVAAVIPARRVARLDVLDALRD